MEQLKQFGKGMFSAIPIWKLGEQKPCTILGWLAGVVLSGAIVMRWMEETEKADERQKEVAMRRFIMTFGKTSKSEEVASWKR